MFFAAEKISSWSLSDSSKESVFLSGLIPSGLVLVSFFQLSTAHLIWYFLHRLVPSQVQKISQNQKVFAENFTEQRILAIWCLMP